MVLMVSRMETVVCPMFAPCLLFIAVHLLLIANQRMPNTKVFCFYRLVIVICGKIFKINQTCIEL
jgi:hypothetical protein